MRGSARYVHAAREAGLHRAVVSFSTNCRDVLAAAGIGNLFEQVIDGVVAEHEHLRGKPAPDTFLAGACGRAGVGGRVRGRAGRGGGGACRVGSAG
jgi:beta-phosphoglucomutase-like phosphatase (HAD superfamily)